jgi:hypothetical protein
MNGGSGFVWLKGMTVKELAGLADRDEMIGPMTVKARSRLRCRGTPRRR